MLTGLRDGDEVLRARRDGRPLALVVLHGVGADAVEGEAGGQVAGEELSQLPEKWIQDGGKTFIQDRFCYLVRTDEKLHTAKACLLTNADRVPGQYLINN